ncbi:MAG TPA: DUF929 family protein [Ktedonobacteraceae bacterium]|jgi:thiol-disulfide isomerase/thioredoxin|nr:DUF929 family protein [Ktedonobacteraceae bacterium]
MAKGKSEQRSAAARRERERQQRQQRMAGATSTRTPQRNKGPKMIRKSRWNQWYMVGIVVVLIAGIITAFIILSHSQASANAPTPVSATVLKQVTNVDPASFSTVGTGGVQNPLHSIKGAAPLTGPTGKPEFLYIGAEYCPFCAAERWSMVVALSRFGTFNQLYQTASSSVDAYPSTPTFSFYSGLYKHPFYTSQYIDFVAVETQGNEPDSNGNYPVLQTPTTQQQQLFNTYDVAPYTTQAGSIPFLDIANQFVQIGAPPGYSPNDLANMQVSDIANNLSIPTMPVTEHILGASNYLTAALCIATKQQPASVCSTDVIQKIEQTLKSSSKGGSEPGIAVVQAPVANVRELLG